MSVNRTGPLEIEKENRVEVIPIIRDFITQELMQRSDVALADDVALIDEGHLTSLQTVELLMFLEEKFEIEIDPIEVDEENFKTLTTIAALVQSNLGVRSGRD